MSKWLNNIELIGSNVRLEPLTLKHIDGLIDAVTDDELWKLWYTSAPEPKKPLQIMKTFYYTLI